MRVVTVCVGWALTAVLAFGQPARLEFADKVRLVDCSPASSVPCFRLKANIVDAEGAPAARALPPDSALAAHLSVRTDQLESSPFYAAAAQSEQKSRIALILIDVSGSMSQLLATGQSRFDAAKAAALRFLEGFEGGKDQIAVVPFESHQVAATIRSASFAASVEDARRQIAALPVPQPSNNTALYSAVDAGLDLLLQRTAGAEDSSEVMLVVMTDGKNDVRPGDDLGLLGPEGLPAVSGKVESSGVQVIAVGLGDQRSIDVNALDQISTRHYLVEDLESLGRVFTFARELLRNRLQVTFASPWQDRASLAGKNIQVALTLKLADGEEIKSNGITWSAPNIGLPLYEGRCEAPEVRALLKRPGGPEDSGWWGVVRPLLVFAGFGSLILVLWFWVPRLAWPEQYVGDMPVVPSRGRWASQTAVQRGGGRQPGAGKAPPGFAEARGGGAAPQRRPGDETVVQPRAPSGRTRLGNRTRHPYHD